MIPKAHVRVLGVSCLDSMNNSEAPGNPVRIVAELIASRQWLPGVSYPCFPPDLSMSLKEFFKSFCKVWKPASSLALLTHLAKTDPCFYYVCLLAIEFYFWLLFSVSSPAGQSVLAAPVRQWLLWPASSTVPLTLGRDRQHLPAVPHPGHLIASFLLSQLFYHPFNYLSLLNSTCLKDLKGSFLG